MKTASQLRDLRAEKMEAQENLINEVKTSETREFTDDQASKFDDLQRDVSDLEIQIQRAEQIEKIQRDNAMRAPKAPEVKSEPFNLLRYINNHLNGVAHTGEEKRVFDFSKGMAERAGITTSGLPLPTAALTTDRAISVSGDGSNWVESLDGGFIAALRDRMVLPGLGARVMGGLTGNVFMPRIVGGAASWNAETGSISDSGQDTEKVELSPKRLGATALVSKQFLIQSSPDASRVLTEDLRNAMAIALDYAGINGSGSSNEPTGVLNTAGIGAVEIATDGGVPTFAHMLKLESAVAAENAESGSLAYLTNPKVRAKLKATSIDGGSGRMVWDLSNTVNGYNATVSNGVPSNLTKGSGTDLSAAIYGNFNDLVIAQWGVMDLVIDPFSNAKTGQIEITLDGFYDIAVRQPKSFAAIVDAVTE